MTAVGSSIAASLPVFHNWTNPVPETFSQLDGRNHLLFDGHKRFLEMHPQGARSIQTKTEYCILTIMILNFTAPIGLSSWNAKNNEETVFNNREPIHLIRSNKTGKYLCMNNNSVLYQSDTNTSECYFRQFSKGKELLSVSYYRMGVTNNKTKRWFIGFNRDGTKRCGNSTRARSPAARYQKIDVKDLSNSPPFTEKDGKPCCTRKGCKTIQQHDKDDPVRHCKSLVKYCRKSRRNFFKLSLKHLRRYYKRCIQNRDKVRECKNRLKNKRGRGGSRRKRHKSLTVDR